MGVKEGDSPPHSPKKNKQIRTHLTLLDKFALYTEWVTAASVGPHARERDLLIGAFLEKQGAVRGTEEEDGEGPVKKVRWRVDGAHEMACQYNRQSVGVRMQDRYGESVRWTDGGKWWSRLCEDNDIC